jgi:hypothetical protein
MSKNTKNVAEVAPANLEEAIIVIENNKAEIVELKEINAKLDGDLSNAISNANEVGSLNEKLQAKVDELTKKLEKSIDAEKDGLIDELNKKIERLEGNQSSKNIIVEDTKGNSYKLKVGFTTVEGKKYSSADLASNPEVVDVLVKIGSGLLSLIEK